MKRKKEWGKGKGKEEGENERGGNGERNGGWGRGNNAFVSGSENSFSHNVDLIFDLMSVVSLYNFFFNLSPLFSIFFFLFHSSYYNP